MLSSLSTSQLSQTLYRVLDCLTDSKTDALPRIDKYLMETEESTVFCDYINQENMHAKHMKTVYPKRMKNIGA